jgi:hypothetical protein
LGLIAVEDDQSVQPDHAIVHKQLYLRRVFSVLNRDQAAACFDNRKEARRISHQKRIVGCLLEPIKSWMLIRKPLMVAQCDTADL